MKPNHKDKKNYLLIILLGVLLAAAVIAVVVFAIGKGESSQPGPEETTGSDGVIQEDQLLTDESPLYLSRDLYVVRIGNYSGKYVEDGSDLQVKNICSVTVENRGDKTVQLAQFQLVSGVETYSFSLTTLPPGERAVLQELNKRPYVSTKSFPVAKIETLVLFSREPSLHEDQFSVTGSENCVELKNLTDEEITGPIYVYYKTRTADGYLGGITYRLEIPTLKAGESYQAISAHFLLGFSQVLFIDYAP